MRPRRSSALRIRPSGGGRPDVGATALVGRGRGIAERFLPLSLMTDRGRSRRGQANDDMNRKTAKRASFERRLIWAAVASCFAGVALANPQGPQVAAGSATFARSGNALTVTNAPGTVINWQAFSIGRDEVTRFAQQGAASAVLNRVTGTESSAILGQLLSNGRVFLINPNGVAIGAGARIDVAGFVASSLNLSNEDFLAGRMRFTESGTGAKVENHGQVTTPSGGSVYLIAPTVENHGVITAPNGDIVLAAGRSVELVASNSPDIRVQLDAPGDRAVNVGELVGRNIGIFGGLVVNSGQVSATGATLDEAGNIVLKATKDVTLEAGSKLGANGARGGAITVQAETGALLAAGAIEAKGSSATGGAVKLLGDQVALLGQTSVDVSGAAGGGTVLVGGDYQGKNANVQNASRTYFGADATIKADAIDKGDGGKVVVWADGGTRYDGSISARGGASAGDGGFVEVSGKQTLGFDGRVDTSAAAGKFGTLLLDPTNITVVAGATPNPPNAADGIWSFAENPGNQTIGAGAINTLLTANNLTLQATNDITVGSAIAYNGAADRTLTLQANNNITVSQAISTTGGRLGLVMNADADASGAGAIAINNSITTGGGILTATGQNVTANATGTISTAGAAGRAGGNVVLTASAAGAVNIGKAITSAGGTAPAASNGLAGGSVSITGGAVTVANVTSSGSAGVGAGARAGGIGGAITVDANGTTPTITLNGNLDARGGNGINGGTGGAGGAVAALDPVLLTGNRSVLTSGGTGGTAAGGTVQFGNVDSNIATARRTFTVTAGNGAVTLGSLGATNPLGTVNASGLGINVGTVRTVGLANAAGAAVTLNAGTGGLVANAIDTSGGARTTNGAGQNGGAVTLTGNATTTSAITTRGSNGLGANNVGGNGGAVTMNGTGTTSTISLNGAIDTRGGDSVGTGNTGNGGVVTLRATDGGSITGGAAATINTSGGRGQAGGNVLVDQQAAGQTIANVALAGAIVTSGGSGGTNAAGRNAGNVTVNNARTIALGALTARGGNSGGGNAVGGNGGTVGITRAGTASTMTFGGVIDTRGGDSTGTGNTGTGGAVTIDAGAAPNVGSIAFVAGSGIDTRGGRGQTGGNVAIRDASSVAFDATATIDTSGGAGVTTGKNAGTVTMTTGITGPVALGSVTTRGSAAVAANSVGGNGGSVAVTSVGANLLGGIDTRGGDGTGTAVGGTSGTIAINGGAGPVTSSVAGTLTTQGARGSNAANVTITATAAGSVNLAGAINASGGTPATGQAGRAGGAISVTGGDVRVASITTDGGAAATGPGGTAGGITLDANDATPTITLAGNLSARGGNAAGGTGGTGANITIPDPMRLGADVAIDVSAGTGGAPAGRNVTFQGTVNSETATPRALAVNAGGTTTFGGAVGATNALASLTTDAPGTTAINGGSVRTTGTQTYNDNVTLGAATILTTTAGGDVIVTGAANAGANALTLATGAGDATLLNASNNFATFGVTNGNDVALRDANAINLAAANVSGTFSVTAGGALTQSGAITVGGAATLAAAANAITLTNPGNDFQGAVALSNSGVANNIAIRDANDFTLAASSAGGTLTARAGGTITLAGSLGAGAAGNSIVLEAGGNFDNSGAFSLNTGSGRWLVYSSNPSLDNRGGLVYAFKQYSAPIGTAPLGTGNGFLYSVVPSIAPTLSGSATKVYDGTTAAPTGSLAVSPGSGVIDGDTVNLAFAAASYADKNAGTGKTVTATGITLASAVNGAATVYGYQITPTTASAAVGTVTPAPLTVTAQSDAKVYDGTTASGAAPVVTGTLFDAIGTAATQSYDTKNVGAGKTLTAGGLVMADGNGGANYAIAYVADTTGVVTPATLTIGAVGEAKTYDGTTAASQAPAVAGLQAGDAVNGLAQVFDSKNAGPRTLSVSAYTVSDGNGGNNYNVVTTTAAGTINPAALAIAANNASRAYGDVNPPLSATFTGLVPGDTPADIAGLTITTPAVPASNAGPYAINAAGGVSTNYAISYVPGTLTILPAALTITANDASRPIDTPNPPFTATASGFKLGQGFGDLAGTLAFSTPAVLASPVGAYPIVPSGVSSPNYDVSFVNGTLAVTNGLIPPLPPPLPPTGALPVDSQAYIAGLQEAGRFPVAEEERERRRDRRGIDCVELERPDGTRRVLHTCY